MVYSAEDLAQHDGIFGIECDDWEASDEYERMKQESASVEGSREAGLLYGERNCLGIYQVKDNAPHGIRFASLKELTSGIDSIDRANYELVYIAPLAIRDTQTNLHRIYNEYNYRLPEDYTGRTPSISDVIVLQWNGEVSAHYIDGGSEFVRLPSFTGAETDYTSSQLGNTIEIADKEVPAADKAEKESPTTTKTEAGSMPGGLPTVAELTARAEKGEQISVMALLEAIKREKGQAVSAKSTAPIDRRTERNDHNNEL
jgi:hypothetical protein